MKTKISKVDCSRGAPMGRHSQRLNHEGRLFARRVRVNSQGYDEGGAYWGLSINKEMQRLYVIQDTDGYQAFVWGWNSKGVKDTFRLNKE
jgi:hypothetical protein